MNIGLLNDYQSTPLQCPSCKVVGMGSAWTETEVGCEDCGSHPAIKCPFCEECVDWVYTSPDELVFEMPHD